MTGPRALAAVALIGLIFLASMLHATGGRPSLPLDDSFIYFQYARQAAAGQPLVYVPGDGATTGSTSLPWMLVLAAGALLGFDGKAMIFLAMILGGLLLAATIRWAGAAEASLRPDDDVAAAGAPAALPLASVLVLLSGPLQWGAWSGMEIAYFTAAIAWSFRETAAGGGRPTPRAAVAAAFLATARPEGALLTWVLLGAWIMGALRDRRSGRDAAWLLLPAVAAFAQPLVNLVATGDARSSGYLAKTLFALPGADLVGVLRVALLRAASLGAALFGGIAPFADARGLYAYESEGAALFVAPGAGILFLIGVLPAAAREWRERRPGPGLVGIAWIAVLVVATCVLEEPDAHFSRYQTPVLPVFLVFVAVGVARVARALAAAAGGLSWLAPGLRGWLVLCGAASVVFFAAAFGDNSEDIDRMQIRLGETLRTALPPGSVVAINDAGALAYFSGHRTLDLVGLTTPGFAGLRSHGSGVLWEKLESLPPERRPGWFCFFPNWFDFEGIGMLRPTGSVRLLAPSIVDAEKVLASADWSLAGSADEPRLEGDRIRMVDRIDVADPDSERAHGFRWRNRERGADAGSFVRRAGFPGRPGDEAIDGGRTVFGEVEFEIGRDPLQPAAVVARTPAGFRQRVRVSVDGGAEKEVEIYAPGAALFHEQPVALLPPGPEPAHVRIRLTDEAAASAPILLSHVFSLTGVED